MREGQRRDRGQGNLLYKRAARRCRFCLSSQSQYAALLCMVTFDYHYLFGCLDSPLRLPRLHPGYVLGGTVVLIKCPSALITCPSALIDAGHKAFMPVVRRTHLVVRGRKQHSALETASTAGPPTPARCRSCPRTSAPARSCVIPIPPRRHAQARAHVISGFSARSHFNF
eukprot:COSAG02_NODE_164_length_32230_cov_37.505587_20_plen_170_part_00